MEARAGRVGRRLDPDDPRGLRRSLTWLVVLLVAVPFTALLVNVEADGPLLRWDQPVADDLNRWAERSDVRVDAFQAVSWFGWPPVLTAWVAVAAVGCWATGRRRLATFLVLTTAIGAVAQVALKAAVARPRPEVLLPVANARGHSFPSGHAMASTIVYGALLLVVVPRLPHRARVPVVVGTVLLVLAIGLSRLVLGVHFVTDVVGGFVIGVAWLAGAAALFEVWRIEDPSTPPEDDELASRYDD
jgi:undecaprenyl-diphosphatase